MQVKITLLSNEKSNLKQSFIKIIFFLAKVFHQLATHSESLDLKNPTLKEENYLFFEKKSKYNKDFTYNQK
jgi:hypothetical protein